MTHRTMRVLSNLYNIIRAWSWEIPYRNFSSSHVSLPRIYTKHDFNTSQTAFGRGSRKICRRVSWFLCSRILSMCGWGHILSRRTQGCFVWVSIRRRLSANTTFPSWKTSVTKPSALQRDFSTLENSDCSKSVRSTSTPSQNLLKYTKN